MNQSDYAHVYAIGSLYILTFLFFFKISVVFPVDASSLSSFSVSRMFLPRLLASKVKQLEEGKRKHEHEHATRISEHLLVVELMEEEILSMQEELRRAENHVEQLEVP